MVHSYDGSSRAVGILLAVLRSKSIIFLPNNFMILSRGWKFSIDFCLYLGTPPLGADCLGDNTEAEKRLSGDQQNPG